MRMRGCWYSLVGLVCVVSIGCRESAVDESTEQPAPDAYNCLLITLDTTRADRVGCYGHESALTPNLDSLAAKGSRFENAFTVVPLTLPAHATLLTGAYPPTHGLRVNGEAALGLSLPTLAETFQEHGYRTGAFLSAFVLDARFGLDRGFDAYDDQTTVGRGTAGAERRGNEVCDAALAWLSEKVDRPFFAWVHFFDPHDPYDPPEPFKSQLDDPYDGEIAFMDQQIGRLLTWLREHNLTQRTLVVVVGDHGEGFGEHGEYCHGLLLYEETLRVPLILAAESHMPANRVIAGNVSIVDVAPTILEFFKWQGHDQLAGRSLVEACQTGEALSEPCYGETQYPRVGYGWSPLRAITDEQWRYIEAPKPELYNRQTDSGEITNVIAQHPDIATRMRTRLRDMVAAMPQEAVNQVAMDKEGRRKLQSLGYVSAGDPQRAVEEISGSNPRDMIDVATQGMKAHTLVGQGDYPRAIQMLEPLVQQSPESALLLDDLAWAYSGARRFDAAISTFKASMAVSSITSDRLFGLADCYFQQGMSKDARPILEEVLTLDPDHAETHSRLGVICANEGRLELAEEHFKRFLELEPTSSNALSNMANLRMQQRRPQEAFSLLAKAITVDPDCVMAHQGLAEIAKYVPDGRRKLVETLKAALRDHPKNPHLQAQLAWVLATSSQSTSGESNEAIKLAIQAGQASPNDAFVNDVLAACYARLGDFASAIRTADKALRQAQAQNDASLAQGISSRLRLYRAHKPYTQPIARKARRAR